MAHAVPQVTIVQGVPVTVALAPPELRAWGPYQFPALARLDDGRILLSFHVEADASTAYGLPPARAVSADDGRSWALLPREAAADGVAVDAGVRLPDGDRLRARTLRTRPAAELALPPRPFAVYDSYGCPQAVYRVEDLPPACAAGWVCERRRAGETAWVEERAKVHLPGEVRIVDLSGGVMWFPWLFPQFLPAPDGALLSINYTLRRVVDGRFQERCPATVLRSTDGGRSWTLWSEIPYAGDLAADPLAAQREGFTEPFVHFLPDGSALCLLRTTDGTGVGPLYRASSCDGGRIWSPPAVFDDLGVWPQLLTLANGVTLAIYGRPGLFLRATADPAGQWWDARVEVVPPGELCQDTCSYAALLPLGADTALAAYSDFNVAGPDGRLCKAIRVRTLTAVPASRTHEREII